MVKFQYIKFKVMEHIEGQNRFHPKRILLFAVFLFVIVVLWYLLLKPYDYTVKMTVISAPGFVYQAVIDWNKDLELSRGITTSYDDRNPFGRLEYQTEFSDIPLAFRWKIEEENDSTSLVDIGINHSNNSVTERIQKLLGKSTTEEVIYRELNQFYKGMEKYLNESRISIDGKAVFPKAYVAYVSIQSLQDEKADQMIRNSEYIKSFLLANDIELVSHPFVHVKHWDFKSGKIDYDFCFPISQMIDFPNHEEIRYKEIAPMQSVKGSFYGNYSLSDRTWFELHAFAGRNEMNAAPELIEVFHHNPHEGGNSMDWKAEIFMRIKE